SGSVGKNGLSPMARWTRRSLVSSAVGRNHCGRLVQPRPTRGEGDRQMVGPATPRRPTCPRSLATEESRLLQQCIRVYSSAAWRDAVKNWNAEAVTKLGPRTTLDGTEFGVPPNSRPSA